MNDYAFKSQAPALPPVESLSDEQIGSYLEALQSEADKREKRKEQETAAEIRRLARSIGKKAKLDDLGKPGRKPTTGK